MANGALDGARSMTEEPLLVADSDVEVFTKRGSGLAKEGGEFEVEVGAAS